MSAIRLAVTENRLSDPSRVTTATYHDYLDRLGKSWVCEVDGQIAGFGAADKTEASIWALFIDERFGGLGIGNHLLGLMTDYLFALGHNAVVLSTGVGTHAERFYASQGWERGEIKNKVEVRYSLFKPCPS